MNMDFSILRTRNVRVIAKHVSVSIENNLLRFILEIKSYSGFESAQFKDIANQVPYNPLIFCNIIPCK